MKYRTLWVGATSLALAFAVTTNISAALSATDLNVWVGPSAGPGINEAVLVVEWADGAPGLAWGYRWPATQNATGRDLLAAVIGTDARFRADGLGTGFVANLSFDADRNGAPERFHPGFDPVTTEFWNYFVNNDVYYDPADFTKNGHVVPPATSVVSLGNPYAEGRWVSSSTGVLDRPLVHGSWDGFVYAAMSNGPLEPVAAPPIPEPASCLLAALALALSGRRQRW